MKKKVILTMRMARHLIDRGFKVIATVPDKRDIRRNVWVFERSPEFDAACDDYIKMSKIPKRNDLMQRIRAYSELSANKKAYVCSLPTEERTAAFEAMAGFGGGENA